MIESEARQIVESGWLTRGIHCEKFREDLMAYTGAAYCALTTSATTALYSCLKILGIGPGDEVAVSDFSFPASSNVIEETGARPIFIDVCPDSFNMDLEDLKQNWNANIKAVIFVDAFGNLTHLKQVVNFCRDNNVPLIEDAACALGGRVGSDPSGSIADLTCFSFHPRKLLTTGEGGAITSRSEKFSNLIDQFLNHGSRIIDNQFDFYGSGQNFRMSELQALMGWKQLPLLDDMINERLKLRTYFSDALVNLGFKPQRIEHNVHSSLQSLVYKVPSCLNRDELIIHLKTNGVESTLGTYCLSGTKYNRQKYNSVRPISKALQDSTITIPCYYGMPKDKVIEIIYDVVSSLRS